MICSFDSAPGQASFGASAQSWDPTYYGVIFGSIDGLVHSFSCTAVNSWPSGNRYAPMYYATKTVTVDPEITAYDETDWFPVEFGGSTNIPTSGAFSVTCSLPPGVSILLGTLGAEEDIGF
ncbi:hypothetical protein GCM10025793_12770 [Lysobacter lycopersici]